MHHSPSKYHHTDPQKVSDPWWVNMLNVRSSWLDETEIDCTLNDTVLALVSGSDWNDEIYRAGKEGSESETEFSDSGKGEDDVGEIWFLFQYCMG